MQRGIPEQKPDTQGKAGKSEPVAQLVVLCSVNYFVLMSALWLL